MGDFCALLNLYHGRALDCGKEVLVLTGLAWFKMEAIEAGAAVYATRYRRDHEKSDVGHGVGVSTDWSNGDSVASMSADDVSRCVLCTAACSN